MRFHQKRLRIRVADDTDSRGALEFWKLSLELRPEIGRFKAVDAPEESFCCAVGRHSGPAGTEMRVIVRSVKQVAGAFTLPRYCSK